MQARLRRLDEQLAVVRSRSIGMAASPFGPPSRAATPPTEVPRLSRPPAVWPTYAEGGFPIAGDRRGADSVLPVAAKRKASFERVRNPEPKRQRGGTDGKWENRLVPNGRMRNAFQHCSKLLDTLMRDRGSKAYFNAPVDYVALGIEPLRSCLPLHCGCFHFSGIILLRTPPDMHCRVSTGLNSCKRNLDSDDKD
jgi:hypothetical protein